MNTIFEMLHLYLIPIQILYLKGKGLVRSKVASKSKSKATSKILPCILYYAKGPVLRFQLNVPIILFIFLRIQVSYKMCLTPSSIIRNIAY